MHSILSKLNTTKIIIISFCFLIAGILLGFILMPMGLRKLIKSQINLSPKSDVRVMYTKVPFPLEFKIYLFNLTNREHVRRGAKPHLQQIGPFYFEEWKEKFDLLDDDTEDTLSYHYKNTFIFRPDLSGPGLTGNEIITMPHPLISGLLLSINIDKKPMLPLISKAVNIVFNDPIDIFWQGRVMDILFDGIPVDCSSNAFEAAAVCSVFSTGEVSAVLPLNETHYKFSLFGSTNATDLGEFKVMRGVKNYNEIGKVVAFNGETEMDVWPEDECNQYVGTDSTIFSSLMDVNDGIWAYEPAICRSLGAHYVGKSKYMGVPTAQFDLDIGSEQNTKECFCRDFPDDCPKKGTFDLFPCVGAPMFGSLPHFFNADPSLLDNIEGLSPNKEEHAIFMHFETLSGTPMSAAKRLQFNLEVVPIEEVPIMQEMREMLYPMFWVEEGANLNKTYVNMIKNTLILAVRIKNGFKWMCIIGGICGLIFAGVLFYMKENAVVEVSSGKKPALNRIKA
uniref:Sensory neuron membrane protein 1 n=1 Tax=Mayetiola destructor TaxID=39758 RepID=A0A1D8GZG9_MAYDE|nr:sensory neuron membrane protein 1E [Mayetiola destructor]